MPHKLNNEIFIEKSKLIHGDFFDYSKVNYKGTSIKVEIGCPLHGHFLQTPNCHLRGRRCPKCYGNIKYNNETFIKQCEEIWGKKLYDNYDLSQIDYHGNKNKIKIFCKIHNDFFYQRPDMFLQKHGCDLCNGKLKIPNKEYIKFCNTKHNFIYDYSRVNYNGSHKKIEIGCKNHGNSIYWFKQNPSFHKNGGGCPLCKSSRGELKIKNFLDKNYIVHLPQHSFYNCKYKNMLFFDFYLPNENTCIEYDGIQHDIIIEHFGGKDSLDKQKIKDSIKNNYCKKNNIKLLRISYKDYGNIEKILKTAFLL